MASWEEEGGDLEEKGRGKDKGGEEGGHYMEVGVENGD